MLMPFIYRLIGYAPIREPLKSDRVVDGAIVEIRAAVGGLREDVGKLIAAAAEKSKTAPR